MARKLSRKKAHRELMLRNLATSLILYERIKTTSVKAKELKSIIEKKISAAKKETLQSRRKMLDFFLDKKAVAKMFEKIVPRYKERSSGFVRIYKTNVRLGDAAPMAMIELIKEKEDGHNENEAESKPEKSE